MKESIMTKIKLCGLTRECDILAANELMPEYIGFVFVNGRRRYVSPDKAAALRRTLAPGITPVGVFINENPETVAELLRCKTIDAAQLHGDEDDEYIERLRKMTDKPIIKAFRIGSADDIEEARRSSADYVLLDSGTGTGKLFDWSLIKGLERDFFLAGGLDSERAAEAVALLNPYAVDVSSGIETDGYKDKNKMQCFVRAVRKANGKDL